MVTNINITEIDRKYNNKKDIISECPNCKESINTECACLRNKCDICNQPVGNITFTVCDICWDWEHNKKRKTK